MRYGQRFPGEAWRYRSLTLRPACSPSGPRRPSTPKASAALLPRRLLYLLPAVTIVAGWELHALRIHAFRGTPRKMDSLSRIRGRYGPKTEGPYRTDHKPVAESLGLVLSENNGSASRGRYARLGSTPRRLAKQHQTD